MLEGKECDVDFVQLDLIDKSDVILSLSWKVRAINKLIASNRKHVCRLFIRLLSYKCLGTLTSAQLYNERARWPTLWYGRQYDYTRTQYDKQIHRGQAAVDFTEAHAAPKVHHLNNSNGLKRNCSPRRQHPRRKKPVAWKRQHGNPRSIGELIGEVLAVAALQQLKEFDRISPIELTKISLHEPERISVQCLERISIQEVIETLNVTG